MTNVFKCKIYILIRSSMCGFKVKARYLVFVGSTCLQAIRTVYIYIGISLCSTPTLRSTAVWTHSPAQAPSLETNRRGSPAAMWSR